MLIKDLPIEEFKPGIKFITHTGKIAVVAEATSRSGHYEKYGPSSNGASYDGDDHWFFFELEGDDWWGHGAYFYHAELEILEMPS